MIHNFQSLAGTLLVRCHGLIVGCHWLCQCLRVFNRNLCSHWQSQWHTALSVSCVGAFTIAIPDLAQAQSTDPIREIAEARRVYVPLDEIDLVMERDKQGVVLPKVKFDALVAQAKANSEKNPVPNGVPVVLTQADYAARIAGDQLLISVTAGLNQFEESWQETKFGLQRLSLEQALLDNAPAMIGRNSDGSVSLLTETRGKHTLTLQLSSELSALGSDQIAAFSLLKAPSGSLTLSLPAGKRLLFGNLQLQRPTSLDQVADYKVAVGGLAGVHLRVTDRAADNSADSMTFASTGYGLNVAPGEVTWHALTTLQVFGKPVDRLTFSVPSQLEIADIESTGLEAWDLSDDANEPGRTNISLTFGQAFDGARKISFKGVMATKADQPWTVPALRVTNVASHIGQVVIQHAAGVRLRVEETVGVRRATAEQKPAADMPDGVGTLNPIETLRFDIWQSDFTLRLVTQPKQREVQTAVAAVLDVNVTGLDLQAAITVETHFAPLLELDIHIPAEWQVLSVQRDNQPLEWQIVSLDQPGIHHLRILLKPSLAAEASGQIRLALRRDVEGWPVEAEPITVNLPELFLPQSSLSEGALVVRGDDNLDLSALDLVGLDPQPLKADYERLRFQSQDTHFSGKLKIARKPSRISAQTVIVGRIDPQTIHAFMQMAVEVQGGGVRTLQIALPESAGTALHFECSGPQIVEQKPANVVKGERIWNLQFDQRLRGQALIVTDLELPRGDLNEYLMPQPRFVEAERQTGYFAVEASGEQRLSIVANDSEGAALSEADPLDLPKLFYLPKERIVAVYRAIGVGAVLKISEQKFEKLPVATAICPHLGISTILGRTGELQHRATFLLNVVGVQGLHVTFPAETTLWATLVNGRPVEVRRNGDVYLVPLSTDHPEASRPDSDAEQNGNQSLLQLFYRSGVRPVTQSGSLNQEPPILTVESGQRVALPVEVLEQKWNLFYPEEIQVVDSRGPLEPEQQLDKTGILGRWTSRVRIPSTGEFVFDLFLVAVALGAFVLLTRGFRPSILMVTQFFLVILIFGVLVSLMLPAAGSRGLTEHLPTHYYADDDVATFGRWKKDKSNLGKPVPAAEPAASNETVVGLAAPRPTPAPQKPAAAEMAQKADETKGNDDKWSYHAKQAAGEKRKRVQGEIGDIEIDGRSMAGEYGENQQANLGLLSLQIGFEPPAGSRKKTFSYFGAETSLSGIPLEVSYVDRHSKQQVRIFVMALFGLIGWVLKRSDPLLKWKLATVGIVLPFALLPIVPVYGQNLLDGCLFGTLVAIAIWLICGSIKYCLSCCTFASQSGVVTGVSLLMTLLAFSGSAVAADNQPAAKPTPVVKPALTPSVIVPFAAGSDPLASDRVLLSYDQFLKLYQLANPEKSFKQPAPQNGGIIEAFYAVKLAPVSKDLDESVVEVTARYAARSLIDGQFIVELPVGQVSARAAKLDGQTAALISGATGFSVAIEKPGLHVIDFTFAVPARLSGTTGSYLLPLKPVPAGKLSFELPAKDLSVRINGSTTIFRRVTQGDSQSLELPVDKGGDLSIAWQPKQAQGSVAAVVHVDSVEAITLTDAGAAISHGFSYRIRQGGVSDVTVALPDSLKLQAVTGPDVGGWELQDEQGARKLRIVFRRNVTDITRLTIETFLEVKVNTEATVVAVPQIVPQEVTTEIGQVAVFAGNQFSIRAEQTESLIQVDADKFSTQVPVSRPNVAPELAYRFSKRPFSLNLRINRLESLAHVAAQQASFISLHKQHLTTRLRYNLTGAPRSSLSVALPEGFVLLDVQTPGLRDWYLTKQEDSQTLTVELNSPKIGQIELVIAGFTPCEASMVAVKFPQPLEVTRLDSSAAIWLDEGFTATVGSSDGWRSVDTSLLSSELKSVRQDHPAQFAFTSTNVSPSPLSLKLTQSTPKITANGLSMVTVTDISVIYTLALQWKIEAAKTDTLTLTTPNWLAGKLEFQGEGLREAVQSDAGNDRTRWTIYFRSPLSGKYFATATATLPPDATQVLAPSLVFENELKPVESQRQYLLLINASLSQLTSTDPSLIESVQREDVPLVIKQEFVDQATELVRVRSLLSAPKWSVHRFPQQQSAPASVNVADMTTVLSRDGTYRAQAIYTIKNRSRQFLALKMPEGTELLSVFVNGQPSRAVQSKLASLNGSMAHLIALPKTSAASLSFPVKIVWRGSLGRALPKSSNFSGNEFEIPAPQILSQQQDADFGIPIARTRWAIYLPDDLDAEASRSMAKHNLSLTDDTNQVYGKAALQEASELIGVVEGMIESDNYSSSLRTNTRQIDVATSNLKQLGLALHGYQYQGTDQAEFNRNKDSVMKRLSEIEKLARDEIKKENRANTKSDQSNGQPFSEDAIVDRVLQSQQGSLIQGNGIEISTEEKLGDVEFRFGLVAKPAEEAPKADKQAAKSGSVSVLNKATNQGRAGLRMSNDANVVSLNEVVTNNTINRNGVQGVPGLQQQQAIPQSPMTQTSNSATSVQGQRNDQSRIFSVQFDPLSDSQINAGTSNGPSQGVTEFFWKDQLSLDIPQSQKVPSTVHWKRTKERNTLTPTNDVEGIGGMEGRGIGNAMNGLKAGGGFGGGQFGGGGGNVTFNQMGRDVDSAAKGQRPFGMDAQAIGNRQEQLMDMAQMDGMPPNEGKGLQPGEQRRWNAGADQRRKQAGGLSLDINLPEVGRKLVFTKTGGDPKLSLIIRPQQSAGYAVKLVWSAAWVVVGVLILLTLQKPDGLNLLLNKLPVAAIVGGILGFFLLDHRLSQLSFGVFLLGILLMTIKLRKQTVAV